MTGKRSQPAIGNIAGVWESGKSKGMKKYDLGGGVGLGIVAALERSELVSHHKPNKHVFITRNQARLIPSPVEIKNNEEDYTFVTFHGANKANTSTTVYYDGGPHDYGVKTREQNIGFEKKSARNKGCCVFDMSSPRFLDDVADFPKSDFLSFCHLCHKNLHGKDIYIYRGEKAFCSTECRYLQISKDERKDKQLISGSASSRSSTTTADNSTTSPYNTTTNDLIFATGIFAT